MAFRHVFLAVAALLGILAACSHKDAGGDYFCAGPDSYIYAPTSDCGTGITALDVEAPCAVKCIDPGYAECPGPCIVWRISALQPTASCGFTVHFKSAPDFSSFVTFEAVSVIDPCNDKVMGSQYYLSNGVASRSADASVETSVTSSDAALEADVSDSSADASDGAIREAGDGG